MGLGDGAMGLGCSMVGGRGEISENVSCAPRNGGRKGANLLVGLNREIIQTGWRIGDPLRFLLSQLAPLCILLRLRRLHLSRRTCTYCIAVCLCLKRDRDWKPMSFQTVILYRRQGEFVHSLLTHSKLQPRKTHSQRRSIGGSGNGGISSFDSPFFSSRASSNVRPPVRPSVRPFSHETPVCHLSMTGKGLVGIGIDVCARSSDFKPL